MVGFEWGNRFLLVQESNSFLKGRSLIGSLIRVFGLEGSSIFLFSLDCFKQGFKIPLSKAGRTLALNDFNEDSRAVH